MPRRPRLSSWPCATTDTRRSPARQVSPPSSSRPAEPAYAFIVQSTIPSGQLLSIDQSAAERAAGVLAVITPFNAPKLPVAHAPASRAPPRHHPAGKGHLLQRPAHRRRRRRKPPRSPARREPAEDSLPDRPGQAELQAAPQRSASPEAARPRARRSNPRRHRRRPRRSHRQDRPDLHHALSSTTIRWSRTPPSPGGRAKSSTSTTPPNTSPATRHRSRAASAFRSTTCICNAPSLAAASAPKARPGRTSSSPPWPQRSRRSPSSSHSNARRCGAPSAAAPPPSSTSGSPPRPTANSPPSQHDVIVHTSVMEDFLEPSANVDPHALRSLRPIAPRTSWST